MQGQEFIKIGGARTGAPEQPMPMQVGHFKPIGQVAAIVVLAVLSAVKGSA